MNVPTSAVASPLSEFPWVETLIAMDTTSRLSNLALIETVRDNLNTYNLPSTLTYDPTGQKANLFATVPAADGSTQGGIILSGHTDVVPVDGQQWDSDPFAPRVENGRLFGRGACDMKGFVGVALSLVPLMTKAPLAMPIHFALSYDEEIGCAGVFSLIEDLKRRGIRPHGCIVGEPTGMRVVSAHKGINAYRCKIRGHAAHSSLQLDGVNAIEYAARISAFIQDMADNFQANGPFDQAFDVPYTTAQVGTIAGGIAFNTIPADCEFSFEFRNLPGTDAEAIFQGIRDYANDTLLPKMRKSREDVSITFEKISAAPAFHADEESAIAKIVRKIRQDQAISKVAYGTEAGLFQAAGVPGIVCGPGNIGEAHKANEFVELEQLSLCKLFIQDLIEALSSPLHEHVHP